MELGNKVSFGFSGVVAGQKTSGNDKPQLIANSTPGKFTLTAVVSKLMGVAVGENIQFVHNMAEIQRAIDEGDERIAAIAAELGADLTSREGQLAVINACAQWGIIKGQPMVDGKGNPVMVSMRLTEDEKRAYIKEHSEEILAANREALIERVGNPEASDEELIAAVQIDEVNYPKVPGFTGSKTSTTSANTGVGLQLGFTDSSVWKQLKSDLGDAANTKNRIFDVLVDNVVKTTVDGKEVLIYPIVFKEDADPIRRGEE